MANSVKSKMLCIRCSPVLRGKFYRAAKKYGEPSEVMREMMQALVDNRLVIQPDPKKPTLENSDVD